MIDITSLVRGLPVSALEPNSVACLDGFVDVPEREKWQSSLTLLEPPCSQRVPYIDPARAIELFRRRQSPQLEPGRAIARLKAMLAPNRWVYFLDHICPNSSGCVPVPDFVAWLRDTRHVNPKVADFLYRASVEAVAAPIFEGPDNRGDPWSLQNLPDSPPPKAMFEFLPAPAGGPWYFDIEWDWEHEKWRQGFNPFAKWQESIKPIAAELERVLGRPVYRFADPNCAHDDDDVHRFLVLHWCCTYRPKSTYVQYLVRVSGARDVEELKAALIDPASYIHSFEMTDTFDGLEARGRLRFEYGAKDELKTLE